MMTRREMLLAALAAGGGAVAAALLPWQRVGQWFGTGGAGGTGSAADALLLSLDGVTDIGRVWLEGPGQGQTLDGLLERVLAYVGNADRQETMVARLAERVREDHAQQRWCELDGWRLAQSECELAGLRWLAFGATATAATAVAVAPEVASADTDGTREIVPISNWGPRGSEQGAPFNVQADGHSGLWFVTTNAPSWLQIWIDGEPAPTTVGDTAITSGLFGEQGKRILSTPGSYRIELVDPVTSRRQLIGDLDIRPRADRVRLDDGSEAAALCEVTAWGPDRTRVGEAANAQPDGSMGLWFRTACAPVNVRLMFGEDRLPMTRTEFGLTCRVPLALIESVGVVPIRLLDADLNQSMPVGAVTIHAEE